MSPQQQQLAGAVAGARDFLNQAWNNNAKGEAMARGIAQNNAGGLGIAVPAVAGAMSYSSADLGMRH